MSRGKKFESFDPETGTYICRKCSSRRVEIHCRGGCGKVQDLTACELENVATYRKEDASFLCFDCLQSERGKDSVVLTCERCNVNEVILTPSEIKNRARHFKGNGTARYLCKSCRGQDMAPKARAALVNKLLDPEHRVSTYADDPDVDAVLKNLPENADLSRDAKLQRAVLRAHIKSVVGEAGGHSAIVEKSREKREQDGWRGWPWASREMAERRRLSRLDPDGELCRCPRCHRLWHVLPPKTGVAAITSEGQIDAAARRDQFHPDCWQQWAEGAEHRRWRAGLGRPDSALFRFNLKNHVPPMPPGPSGRPAKSDEFKETLRWLLRHYLLRESWDRIGDDVSYSRQRVRDRVRTLVSFLPDHWMDVFPPDRDAGRFYGCTLGTKLDHLVPIDRIRTSGDQ
jgi:hypothetical protein